MKSVAHAGGTTNLKSHVHTWHPNEYESLFSTPDSRPKQQPTLADYMRPTRVKKLAVNSNRAKKLTTAVTEFIAKDLRPIATVDGTPDAGRGATIRCALSSYNNCPCQ